MRHAFSLVELSIVLVILGLLTGGILAGQSLIRAAELRRGMKDLERYESTVHIFRDRFFYLPGDMPNATSFWGASANCPGAYDQGTTDGTTCNGNGDGNVSYTDSATNPTISEGFRFWQHLVNAQLIEGQYSGVTAETANNYALGAGTGNTPKVFDRARIAVWGIDGSSTRFNYRYQPYVYVMGVPQAGSWNNGAFLTPQEAWNIDTKMDDGKPGRGVIISTVSAACSGTTDDSNFNAEYNLASTVVVCRVEMNPSQK